MSLTKAKSALTKAFVDGAFFTQNKVQWENKKFQPPSSGEWAAIYFLPAQPVVATLGDGGDDETVGIFQIDLNYPSDSGTQAIDAKWEAIKNVFTAGERFAYEGQEVVIRSCGRSQGRVENNYFRYVVTIAFYCYINR